MACEVEWLPLGDIVNLSSGGTPDKKQPAYWDGEIPWISAKTLTGDTVTTSNLFITEEGLHAGSKLAPVGSILLLTRGSGLFKRIPLAIVNAPVAYNQDVKCMTSKVTTITNEYVFFALKALSPELTNMLETTGIGAGKLATDRLLDMPIPVLSHDEREKAVSFFSALSRKIMINNRINDYLLEVGEMRFADLETRGTLSKTVHIADLPHILETGKRPKGGAASCGIPSVGAENVKKLGEFNYSSNKYIPRTFADNLKKGRVNGYELMIYKDGGRPGQFIPHFSMFGEGYPYKEFYINEHVFKLDFGDRGLNEFAYYYFHTPYVMKWLETNGTKAAIPGINRQNIEELEFPDPEQESVQDFCKRIQPYFTAIFRNCLENKQLQSLRDTLLPRLMSGEIDVSKVDLTQLTNNHLWVHGHNVPNRYWKGRLWKPSLIMFCHRCRTCSIRHSSNIWPKYSESRYCQLRKHPCRRIC